MGRGLFKAAGKKQSYCICSSVAGMSLAFLSRVTEGEDELDLVETVNESLARAFSLPFPQPRCFCKGLSFKTIAVDLHSFTFLV